MGRHDPEDMAAKHRKANLEVRETLDGSTYVPELTRVPVASAGAVLAHFLRVLLERGKRVTVTVLPAAAPGDGATAADFAAAARAAILGALPDGADWADWDNARLRREWYGEDAAKVD